MKDHMSLPAKGQYKLSQAKKIKIQKTLIEDKVKVGVMKYLRVDDDDEDDDIDSDDDEDEDEDDH